MSKKIKDDTLKELGSFTEKSKPLPKTSDFEQGKLYLAKQDVWAIDYASNKEFMIVYSREEQFKITPENLVLIGDDNE